MASLRRLAADHAALHKSELPPYYLFSNPSTASIADDLSQLNILLAGPPGTPYADGLWRLNLRMPLDYPASPPKAFFRTKIWHPNVDESTGSVCLDTLKRDWQPKLTLRDILVTISCLLINPNPDSALNSSAGQLLQEDWNTFARQAKLMTSIHARFSKNLEHAVRLARSRGDHLDDPAATGDEDASEDEMSDFESDGKENDPSVALAESRPLSPVRRSVLGKRPLAELPVPTESEASAKNDRTCSAQNIVANTPNLSNHMASFSLKSGTATECASASSHLPTYISPPRTEQPSISIDQARDEYAETLWDVADPIESFEPASKRARSVRETTPSSKFDLFVDPTSQVPLPQSQCKISAPAGLGLEMRTSSSADLPTSNRSGIGSSRKRPRIGVRRL